MTRRLVHGVHVAVESALDPDPSAPLLSRFPAGASATPPDLTLRLRQAATRAAGGGRLVMDLGSVRAHLQDGVLRLGDGASILSVLPGGALVEGEVHADSLAEPHAFENVLLLMALAAALRWHGLFHLHAAALVSPGGRGILVAGDSGAGKTTLALALARRGFGWLADDVCFLAERTGGPVVLSCPRPFHVAERTAAAFPDLVPAASLPYSWRGKRLVDPRIAFSVQERSAISRPLTVVVPEIAKAPRTTLVPIAEVEALGALLESSALLFVRGMAGVERQVALVRDLLSGARCVRVELGEDLLGTPAETAERLAVALGDTARIDRSPTTAILAGGGTA